MQNITVAASIANSNSNVICSCNCSGSQPQGMEISELEFVQIVVLMVVMSVMVVVMVCLLTHYRPSAWAFLSRHGPARTPPHNTHLDGCVWPSDSLVTQQGTTEVMYGGSRPLQDRLRPPSYLQRGGGGGLCRSQPTYPPRLGQQDIPLPPTISLADGEELPPYKGPCTLQLRDPEQQLELSRSSIRAPPNRTIFDSDLIDVYVHGGGGCGGGGGGGVIGGGGPKPPSSNSGVSAIAARSGGGGSSHHGRTAEAPPPTYSQVMGHYPGSSSAFRKQDNSNNGAAPPPFAAVAVATPGNNRTVQGKESTTAGRGGGAGDGQPAAGEPSVRQTPLEGGGGGPY